MASELVLTRGQGDSVVIETSDGPICVTVRALSRGRVRLGFSAPPDVPIMRGELQRGGGKRFDEEFRR